MLEHIGGEKNLKSKPSRNPNWLEEVDNPIDFKWN